MCRNTVFGFILPILAGVLCIGASSIVFSLVTFFLLRTMMLAGAFTVVSLISGGFVSGYICGKYRRRYGLIDGLICGGMLAAILTGAAYAITGELPSLYKPILLIISGMVGGVYGVNSPLRINN